MLHTSTISKRFQVILWITPLIVLLHGIEEYITGLWHGTSMQMVNYASLLPALFTLNKEQSVYIVYVGMLFPLTCVIALLLSSKRKALIAVLSFLGIYFVYQMHHILEAALNFQYNPGLATSVLYLIAGVFYWRELVHVIKS